MLKAQDPGNRSTSRLSNTEFIKLMNQQGLRHLVGKVSNRGMQRPRNEDSVAVMEYTHILRSVAQPIGFYLVADGLGAYAGGEVASQITAQCIMRELLLSFFGSQADNTQLQFPQESYREMLENAVFTANDAVLQRAQALKNEMGSTVSLAVVAGRTAYMCNVGDSRIYLYNEQQGLQLLTQDHSLVFRFYMMGDLTFEEIQRHPQRNHLLRSLGEAGLREKLLEMQDKFNHPYIYQATLEYGDRLLLCSDGLWQTVPQKRITKILTDFSDSQEACEKLVEVANKCGGDDNISAVIVNIG
ncbi:serine/threonine-protein phosphatase [bacterium]|nr:serine/threonine-protein phosphatase [bacterium]